MANFEDTLARMQYLMDYKAPINEKKTGVEYSAEGADGKRYGIIKEGTKFYIKYSDKNAPNIAESYDYINGILAKKENEYNSYNAASKHLELKLISLNEAYNANLKTSTVDFDRSEKVFSNLTEAARTELDRMHQIMEKSMHIGNPEAPQSTQFNAVLGKPFDEAAKATLDKDVKEKEIDPKNQGEPFERKEKCCNVDMQGDKNPKCIKKCDGTEPAKFVPDGAVAAKKPAGGKVVRMDEDVTIEPTEDDNLLGFEDEQPSEEDIAVDDFNTEGVSDESLDDMFNDGEDVEPTEDEDDSIEFDDEETVDNDAYDNVDADMPMESKHSLKNIVEGVCKNLKNEMKAQALQESFSKKIDKLVKEEASKLNVFGKHPGYRKKPMTTPVNKEVLKKGTKSWDDDSAKGEEPFGSKIGDGFPFNQKVEILTDQVMKYLKENLKKK